MNDSNNQMAVDYLVTFFIADHAISKMLSDVVKNRENKCYMDMLGLPEDFSMPFFLESSGENNFFAVVDMDSKYKILLDGEVCQRHIIQNGDYISFQNNDIVIKALFIESSFIKLGYKKYYIEKNTNIFIGRLPVNEIAFSFSPYISREKHAALRVDNAGNVFIEDLKRSVGIYVNGIMVHSKQLELFDEIFIMGLSIIYMGSFLAVRDFMLTSSLKQFDEFDLKRPDDEYGKESYFVNTPRIMKSLDKDIIEIDAPPAPAQANSMPLLLRIGPSLTMSVVMLSSLFVAIGNAMNGGNPQTLIMSGSMCISMLLGALLWPSLLRYYQKRKLQEDEEYRQRKYMSYISDIEDQLISKTDRTIRLLNDSINPAPQLLWTMLDNEYNKLRLWERSSEDEDFLDVRLGLGQKPFDVQIKIPRQGFQLYDDTMRELPVRLSEKYGTLSNVPLTLDLCENRTVGIIGDTNNVHMILQELILNIIALHSYDEVKLVLITKPNREKEFEVFKNVPHIWSNDKKVRFFAVNSDEVHYIFNVLDEIFRQREAEKGKGSSVPHYVVIVTEPELIEKEALVRYMYDAENCVGLTSIFAYEDITKLPRACKTIIQSDELRTGYYIKNKNENHFIPFTLDTVDDQKIENFADAMSGMNIKRDQQTLGIVDSISFMQMYKAGNIEELEIEQHWANNNSAKSLAAPVGVMAGGEVFNLDIHESYHGCHGLVAGTTGSGKSEFLQAFILSLCINFSPKEIAFVLIDFKGGDMARPFMAKKTSSALPHLAATISNLSGNILYRALVSLNAEIRSRQRIFNESAAMLGVDKLDINSYHKYYKSGRLHTPLPHLVIIIDEFAQLKTQQPEFLTELINVAQVGRSLGIHLILATQKPSGIVDPQIMSNSRFKVCLKVADKQDSMDMLSKPDAAKIKNPGRLYLQVGYDEIYKCMQSGYSGANYIPTKKFMPDEEITVQMTDHTSNPIHSAKLNFSGKRSDKTQLEAIVAEIAALGEKKHLSVKPLWLDVLPEKILLNSLNCKDRGLCSAVIGLADFVRVQKQSPLVVDLARSGHIGLYGSSGTGKTTFLQTIVYSMVCGFRYTPEELNIYALDFGGRNLGYLSSLPHTGGVAFADEENKMYSIVSILTNMIDERKKLFANNNCSSFTEYHAAKKCTLPAVLVLIDNFASFREKYLDVAERFIEIIGSGKTYGVYFVITGSTKNAIYYKVRDYIPNIYALKMNDPSNYLDILNKRPPVMPEDISGRGITVIDKDVVEFQTALAYIGETEADRILYIEEQYRDIYEKWDGYLPIPLQENTSEYEEDMADEIPVYKTEKVDQSPDALEDIPENLLLGHSLSGAVQYGVELSKTFKICICAEQQNDLQKYFRTVLESISKYDNRKLVLIDTEAGKLSDLASEFENCRYICGSEEFDVFIDQLKPVLNNRLSDSNDDQERLFIVISEFKEIFEMMTDDQAIFMRKVFKYINSPKYGIYFICGYNAQGYKINDALYVNMVVHADSYIFCPNSYDKAAECIENIPTISQRKKAGSYLCIEDKVTEIRW